MKILKKKGKGTCGNISIYTKCKYLNFVCKMTSYVCLPHSMIWNWLYKIVYHLSGALYKNMNSKNVLFHCNCFMQIIQIFAIKKMLIWTFFALWPFWPCPQLGHYNPFGQLCPYGHFTIFVSFVFGQFLPPMLNLSFGHFFPFGPLCSFWPLGHFWIWSIWAISGYWWIASNQIWPKRKKMVLIQK